VYFCVCVGDISFLIKTEADRNDITQCSYDDMPSTGMFAVSETDDIFSVVSYLFSSLTSM